MHAYGWSLAIWTIAPLLIPARAGSFVCLPRPVKFDTCTSIRLLGPCQTDQDCETRVCCKDWCGNYCAFKQHKAAVGENNANKDVGGREGSAFGSNDDGRGREGGQEGTNGEGAEGGRRAVRKGSVQSMSPDNPVDNAADYNEVADTPPPPPPSGSRRKGRRRRKRVNRRKMESNQIDSVDTGRKVRRKNTRNENEHDYFEV
ncbi:uncharacterized protein LOC135397591 [Ornithodoros turicata]|uniref:uncharacterized protein LOC135397591 n=1 Tax=Ornithodoros turicata TaxID=34597 RepID=UPI003139B8F6